MLFEEFFKKKKINLDILQKGEPELFSEFKEHYAQMGEKSFDHTKKYWFNKLRKQYPLPPEVKVEKIHAENQIAEQTIADVLTEPTPQQESQKLGFRPKFKAGVTSTQTPATEKPAEPANEAKAPAPAAESAETPATDVPTKIGFKPRFKAGVTAKPATEDPTDESPKAEQAETASDSTEQPAKIGFKPRFKAGVTASKPAAESTPPEEAKVESTETPEEQPVAKLGFKPRFKAGVATSKPAEEVAASLESNTEEKSIEATDNPDVPSAQSPEENISVAPKLGFKPRFKAGATTSQPAGQEIKSEEAKTEDKQPEIIVPVENPSTATTETSDAPVAPKLGFKPRFKAGVTTSKPVEQETLKTPVDEVKVEDPEVKSEETDEKPAQPETPPAKQPYKPRFTPNMIKPKPPAEEESE